MKFRSIRRSFAAVVAMAATWGALSTAHAATAIASFDPAYGIGIPNLGFRGTGQFYVPDACLSQGPGLVSNGSACAPNYEMLLQSAQVSFYNLAAPTTTLFVANYSAADGVFTIDINVQGGVVAGVDTSVSNAMHVVINQGNGIDSGASEVNFDGYLALQFFSGYQLQESARSAGFTTDAVFNPSDPLNLGYVQLYQCRSGDPEACSTPVSTSARATTVIVTSIPEPSTVLLMLAALGALGWSRTARGRRRSSLRA